MFVLFAGMDPAEQCAVNSSAGQPSPASVRGKIGKNSALHDQGKGFDSAGPGPNLGGTGREARSNSEKRARFAGEVGMGLLSRTTGPFVRVLPGMCCFCHRLLNRFAKCGLQNYMLILVNIQGSWTNASKKQREKLLELIRRLAEDDKEGVMAHKVLGLLWNLAHSEEVPTDIMDQALTAHIKILDYSCSQVCCFELSGMSFCMWNAILQERRKTIDLTSSAMGREDQRVEGNQLDFTLRCDRRVH